MSNTLWGALDQANNSPAWGPTLVQQTANSANRAALYNNTTANAHMGMTVGVFGVSSAEMKDNVSGVASVTVVTPGSGFTVRPTVAFSGGNGSGTTATATAKVVTVALGTAAGLGYVPGDNVTVAGGTSTTAAVANVTSVSTIAAQTQARFNNSGANGTFAVGSNYAPNDTITLSDGTVVTVATETANAVATFSITTPSTTGSTTNHPTLTQSATSGVGTGFTLTLGTGNQGVKGVAVKTAGSYTALPTLTDNQPTGGTGTGLKLNVSFGVEAVTVTANGANYTSAPSVLITGTGATGQTAVAVMTSEETRVPAAGWNLRTVTSAGRVRYETLVAMKSITANSSNADADDSYFPQ